MRRCSERRIVAGAAIIIAGGVSLKPLQERLNLAAVAGPELFAQVVEQVEHGECLFGDPDGGDADGDWPQMRGHR